MLAGLLAILVQSAVRTPAAPPELAGPEVVVVATRKTCGVAIARRILSSKEFDQRSAEWARGVPVRVVVPAGSDYRCLSQLMFKLADRGVTRADFVDQ